MKRLVPLWCALLALLVALPASAQPQPPQPQPPPAQPEAQPQPPATPPEGQPATPPPEGQPATTPPEGQPAAPPPPPGAAVPPPEAPPTAPADGPRIAVVDAAPIGVDRAAGTFVTETLRTGVTRLGFNTVPTPELYAAARRVGLAFPAPAEGLYMVLRVLQAPVGITAEVRAAHGLYQVRIRVRVAVEPMERVRDVSANQWQLGDAIRAVLPALLVPPEAPAAPPVATSPDQTPSQAAARRPRRYRMHRRRWEVGGVVDLAFGPGRDSFFNALLGARVAFYPQDRLGLTATLSYANLRGRQDSRVSNFLPMLGIETAVDLVPARRIYIPLRAEVGYLVNNGPVFRVTAGVSFEVARNVRLEVDVLSPTLWILPETSPVSLDLAASVHVGL